MGQQTVQQQTTQLMNEFIKAQTLATEANRQAILAADANKKAVEDNTAQVQALRQAMELHNAKQEPVEILVRKHEVQLNGDEKTTGLITTVAGLSKTMSNIERAVWVIVGVVLTAVTIAWLGLL